MNEEGERKRKLFLETYRASYVCACMYVCVDLVFVFPSHDRGESKKLTLNDNEEMCVITSEYLTALNRHTLQVHPGHRSISLGAPQLCVFV